MKILCKNLGVKFNLDLETIAINGRLILRNRGQVITSIPSESRPAIEYMQRVNRRIKN
jgi:hypothetical protein